MVIVFQEPDNQLFSPTIEAEVAFGPENLCIKREMIKAVLRRLREAGKPIIMVEHDFENMDLADRILVLKHGRLIPYDGSL